MLSTVAIMSEFPASVPHSKAAEYQRPATRGCPAAAFSQPPNWAHWAAKSTRRALESPRTSVIRVARKLSWMRTAGSTAAAPMLSSRRRCAVSVSARASRVAGSTRRGRSWVKARRSVDWPAGGAGRIKLVSRSSLLSASSNRLARSRVGCRRPVSMSCRCPRLDRAKDASWRRLTPATVRSWRSSAPKQGSTIAGIGLPRLRTGRRAAGLNPGGPPPSTVLPARTSRRHPAVWPPRARRGVRPTTEMWFRTGSSCPLRSSGHSQRHWDDQTIRRYQLSTMDALLKLFRLISDHEQR